jgi:hypothetical protein
MGITRLLAAEPPVEPPKRVRDCVRDLSHVFILPPSTGDSHLNLADVVRVLLVDGMHVSVRGQDQLGEQRDRLHGVLHHEDIIPGLTPDGTPEKRSARRFSAVVVWGPSPIFRSRSPAFAPDGKGSFRSSNFRGGARMARA